MADLITTARAKYNINQSSFAAAETTTIDTLVTAVSKAIKAYCKRQFDSQTFDELYSGDGDLNLILREYPILSVARVATNPRTVLTIKNTLTSTNQRATVAVTSSGLTLVRVASGVTTTDTTITFAGNVTITALAAAVNALGNGWSASITESAYALWPSADLRSVQGALNCAGTDAPLRLYTDEVSDFDVDNIRGMLTRGQHAPEWILNPGWPWSWGWTPGVNNWRVIYTAGYATVPEDVQEACAQWVAALYWQTKENPAVYPDGPSASVQLLLDQYRRHRC